MEENKELEALIDELVSKAGPTAGQIKLNQDPVKVARLKELGWKPKEPTEETIQRKISAAELSKEQIEGRLQALEEVVADHEKRIKTCEVRR